MIKWKQLEENLPQFSHSHVYLHISMLTCSALVLLCEEFILLCEELSKFLAEETPLLVHKMSFPYPLKNFILAVFLSLSCIINSLFLLNFCISIWWFVLKQTKLPLLSQVISLTSLFPFVAKLLKRFGSALVSILLFCLGQSTTMRFLHLELS